MYKELLYSEKAVFNPIYPVDIVLTEFVKVVAKGNNAAAFCTRNPYSR
jgi:hypothetical protein